MKSLIILFGIALIVSSPAMAQTAKRQQIRVAPQVSMNDLQAYDAQTIVSQGQFVGRDPDIQVRLEMQRSANSWHGGY
jgi:hypothetical protein